MDIIDSIIKYKNTIELGNILLDDANSRHGTIRRYESESTIIGILADYALNKEKNKCKPHFEDLFLCDIMQIFLSEVRELEHEIIQERGDPRRQLEEIADCAASLVGLVVNIRDRLNRAK